MSAPIKKNLGFNAFHSNINLTEPGLTICLDDLEYKHGCKLLRANGLPYTFVSGDHQQYIDSKAAIEEALSRGFYVMFGLTLNIVHTTNASQTNVTTDLLGALETLATWAESLDFDSYPEGAMLEIYVGNEEEDNLASNYGGAANITAAKTLFRTDIRTVVATAVKAIYTKGPISYVTYDSEWPAWVTEIATNGWGDLDRFGGNIYRNSAYVMESARSQAVLDLVGPLNSYGYDRFGKRRVYLAEVQSYGSGLGDTRWIKGNESLLEYDIIRRFKLINDRFPDIDYIFFAYDPSGSTNFDYQITVAGAKEKEFRRFRQFFTNKSAMHPHTDKKLFLMEQLIANPFTNENTLDTFSWNVENSATRVVQTSGGVNGGRFMRIKSTTNGNSDVIASSGSSGGMTIPKHMVGIPILLAFWAKYDPTDIPTGTGEASISVTQSAGSVSILEGTDAFLPTADWQRFYYVFRVTRPNNLTLRLWGKKKFLTTQGTVDYDNLLMTPMFNDLMKEQILELHLTESLNNSNAPFAHYQQEPTGSTYVESFRWMPPAIRL